VRRWDWGDRYERSGLLLGLGFFSLLLVVADVPWWLPVAGILVTIAGYLYRQRPWLG
jgi:hypothetical protein